MASILTASGDICSGREPGTSPAARCANGAWGGQRPSLAPYVTVTGPTDGATAVGASEGHPHTSAKVFRTLRIAGSALPVAGSKIQTGKTSRDYSRIGDSLSLVTDKYRQF